MLWLRTGRTLAIAAALALAVGALARGQDGGRVDLELVLAIDSSGSVDQSEFALQMQGLAAAFRDPEVHAALEATGGRGIAVSLMQWAGRRQQVMVVEWTHVVDPASAVAFARRIDAAGRWLIGETAIADALAAAIEAIESNRFDGLRQVIDLSGDGPTNAGRDPDLLRDAAVAGGMTVNGLAITNEIADLDAYYRDHVIGGPGAFVTTARDYRDFMRAIREKLIREIRGAPLSRRDVLPTLARR